MIEYPEAVTIAAQMREALVGKTISSVAIAENHPKFMFLNDDPFAYEDRLPGRIITEVRASGKWIFSKLDSGNILLIGEMFGRILLVSPPEELPKKSHGIVTFSSKEQLAITIQAWGGFQVLTPEELAAHPYAGHQGPSPVEDELTLERFLDVLDHSDNWSRKPIKAFLVHEGNIAGIGNGMLQDILFRAKLSPKRKVPDIKREERARLHQAILETMQLAVEANGRDTEKDLFGAPGNYIPLMTAEPQEHRATNAAQPSRRSPISEARATSAPLVRLDPFKSSILRATLQLNHMHR